MPTPSTTPSILTLPAFMSRLAVLCGSAGHRGGSRRQAGRHKLVWVLIAGLVLSLAAMRFFAVGEILRAKLGAVIDVEGTYHDRHNLQGSLIALLIGGAAVIGAIWFGQMICGARGRRDLANMAALGCGLGMIVLVALQLVSLHSLDLLLYGTQKSTG